MMRNKKALLVIDMQKGSFTHDTPRFDTYGVVNKINALANIFRQTGQPVVFVQHNGRGADVFTKHTLAWELLDELQVQPTDILLEKYANDSFYLSKLQAKLLEWGITELIITGCATDFCIESTVQSALTKDYNITVVADGHTTADRPHLKAEKIIEHYNWVWQNMIPTKGKITVKGYDRIMKVFASTAIKLD
ncbi:isochorismatase family protein [Snuella sedimenti]|uniref:Isochorismatase family protein n=1 Tax=Snuella sedimenti TaxID=2798802 RepID=A0A8J7J1K4_9FLAO|nr:isochorismatase family protein [Snuella sedimenti]MBJ6368002.1 isochorismatase family protein [Snuella sedimenti]